MKIFFAGLQLTDWADYPAQAVSVNGQTVFEAVDIVRAAAARFFSRGNDSVTLQFSVRREFATNRECQVYLLCAFNTLPKAGQVQITCGTPGETTQDVFMDNAVLTATPQGIFNGIEAIVQFTIQGGAFYTDVPPPFYLGGEDMILRASVALPSGADNIVVLFGTAFPVGTVPIITANIEKPTSAGANIFATVRADSVSVNGFTADLSGPTPDANHKLTYIALGT
jgi:hypothetical protein